MERMISWGRKGKIIIRNKVGENGGGGDGHGVGLTITHIMCRWLGWKLTLNKNGNFFEAIVSFKMYK